jgi:hypothetical protein
MAFIHGNVCSNGGCGRDGKLTRGMCVKCYRYWLDHTPPQERPVAPRFARQFWDVVRKDGPVPAHAPELGACWPWTGSHDRKGYGRWGKVLAHRHSWALANGPVPDGLWILHHCDNPPCVNPAHLYAGTVADNVDDAIERGHHYRPEPAETCSKGHAKTGDNLLVVTSGARVLRRCRICDSERSASWQREKRRARGLRKTFLSDQERARILALRDGGMSQRKIAGEVGRSLTAVQMALKAAT